MATKKKYLISKNHIILQPVSSKAIDNTVSSVRETRGVPIQKIIMKQRTNQCLIPEIPLRSRGTMDTKSSIPFFNHCNIISIISSGSHSEFKVIYLKFRHCQCDLVSVLWQLQVPNKYAPFIDFAPLQLLL